MKKIALFCFIAFTGFVNAQETVDVVVEESSTTIVEDSATAKEKNWGVGLDVQTAYIWRGQRLGAATNPAFQPFAYWSPIENLEIGAWATSNFIKDNNRGYKEVDFYASYTVADFVKVMGAWYYYPPMEPVEGMDSNMWSFSDSSYDVIDASLTFDLNKFNIPAYAMVSTIVLGNNYNYWGEERKRAFDTYAEVGADVEVGKITISPQVGAVMSNDGGYYTDVKSEDNGRSISLTNLTLKLSYDVPVTEKWAVPFWAGFTYNPSIKRDEKGYGPGYFYVGMRLEY